MKNILLVACMSMIYCLANAQTNEPITLIDGTYYQGDVPLKNSTIKQIVKVYPPAFQEVKSGRSRITWGYIFAGMGGLVLGGGVSSLVFGETSDSLDPLTGILGGAVIGGLGYWLASSGAKKFAHGIEIYNSHLTSGHIQKGISVRYGPGLHGIGFIITF
jgi:hypothetical protein